MFSLGRLFAGAKSGDEPLDVPSRESDEYDVRLTRGIALSAHAKEPIRRSSREHPNQWRTVVVDSELPSVAAGGRRSAFDGVQLCSVHVSVPMAPRPPSLRLRQR